MSLADILQSNKSKLTALLNFANEKTGADDVSIGDAIKTLADGYGQGGSDDVADKIVEGTIEELVSNSKGIRNSCFYEIKSLKYAKFTSVTNVGQSAFRGCSNLKTLEFFGTVSFSNFCFYDCSSLNSLILRSTTMCTYNNTSSSYEPKNTSLKIYVPRELLEFYKKAANWSRFANNFVALEDYTVDGTTTGEMNKDSNGNIIPRA